MDFTPGSVLRFMIGKEFMEPIHDDLRSWFFSKFSEEFRTEIQEAFYEHLSRTQTIEYFCKWFERSFFPGGRLSVLVNHSKTWRKTDGSNFTAVHPPTSTEICLKGRDDKVLKAIPFFNPSQTTNDNIALSTAIIHQNNFININLGTISEQ